MASIIECATKTFTAKPDVQSAWSCALISLMISGCHARMPIWPELARACWCSTFFFVAADHPHFVSLSIHFWTVPFVMWPKSLGWSQISQFLIECADQPTLWAALSIYAQRNGWYQLVCLCRLYFALPHFPFCSDFQFELDLDSSASSVESEPRSHETYIKVS